MRSWNVSVGSRVADPNAKQAHHSTNMAKAPTPMPRTLFPEDVSSSTCSSALRPTPKACAVPPDRKTSTTSVARMGRSQWPLKSEAWTAPQEASFGNQPVFCRTVSSDFDAREELGRPEIRVRDRRLRRVKSLRRTIDVLIRWVATTTAMRAS